MPLFQFRALDTITWPFAGLRNELDYLLLAAMGASFLLALYERASRAPQGPAWSLLIAVPWVVLVTSFVIDRLYPLNGPLGSWQDGEPSISMGTQQLGEIAVGLLAINLLRVFASRAMRLQFLRVSHHLITGVVLLMFWAVLDHHWWSVASNTGGYDFEDHRSFAKPRAQVAIYLGWVVGGLFVLGSAFLVIWQRRRTRKAQQNTQLVR